MIVQGLRHKRRMRIKHLGLFFFSSVLLDSEEWHSQFMRF